jgi:4-hydroxybenzoate polyprenyltransferase
MGFAVILARIDAATLVLYAGSIAWVIGYDTIYARQRVGWVEPFAKPITVAKGN